MPRTFLAVLLCTGGLLLAQPRPVTPADYGKFESLGPGLLSPDGKWLAYAVNRSDRNNQLRVTNVATGDTRTVAFGSQPAFSSDSQWLACATGQSEAQEEKLRKDKKPVQRKLTLIQLGSNTETTLDAVESFAFSPNGADIAFRRYAPEKPAAAPNADADTETPPAGAALIVRHLATGRDTTFGGVSEYAWQDQPRTGHLLAFATSADDKTGNGVELFDPSTGVLRVLDSGPAVFSGLSWRKKSADLAAFRSRSDATRDGSTQILLAWRNLGAASESASRLDPTAAGTLAADLRTVSFRKPAWNDDGSIVFAGVAAWDRKTPKPADASKDAVDDPPAVDIWHWRDTTVLPKQKHDAKADRERSTLAAWHLDSGKLVRLGEAFTERIVPLRNQSQALAVNWTAYAMPRSIGRPAADLSLVDLTTGKRQRVRQNVPDDFLIQPGPAGKYILFLDGDHYWTINTATGAATNITKGVSTSFIDRESDDTSSQKPSFGVGGWTRGDEAVILYDKFDAWQVSTDGSGAKKLTDGAKDQVRHRYLRLDPEEEFVDLSQPVYSRCSVSGPRSPVLPASAPARRSTCCSTIAV